MENIEALRARQARFIADHNARVRGAAVTARNQAQWAAFFATNPDPEALFRQPSAKPAQYVVARADARNERLRRALELRPLPGGRLGHQS